MEVRKHFCTCKDVNCKLHPTNHDRGCDFCVQKCLKLGEIPSCFFRLVDDDISHQEDFTLEGFAKFVLNRHPMIPIDPEKRNGN